MGAVYIALGLKKHFFFYCETSFTSFAEQNWLPLEIFDTTEIICG